MVLTFRPGYTSSGGFSVNEITALPYEIVRPLAPAYRLHCCAARLDRKDVMGKSGNQAFVKKQIDLTLLLQMDFLKSIHHLWDLTTS